MGSASVIAFAAPLDSGGEVLQSEERKQRNPVSWTVPVVVQMVTAILLQRRRLWIR
jgi:hypothetical protein